MKLVFEEPACTSCGACLSVCPKGPKSVNLLKCKHCPPESAPCKIACPLGAIKQSGDFLFIDSEECNGCGECERRCPHGAIEIVGDKAIKCDTCLGKPLCMDYCPEEAIRILRKEDGTLGWRIRDEKVGYSVGIPNLSKEEEEIIRETCSRFREEAKRMDFGDKETTRLEIEKILTRYCEENELLMEVEQFRDITRVALMQVSGFGPLDSVLADDSLEEIAVVGLSKPIYVYRRGVGWLETDCEFTSEEVFVNTVNKMARPLGRRLSYQSPRMNAVLPDGSRLHASMPPISQLELTIRKFRANPISVPELIAFGTASSEAIAFLWLAMKIDTSIVVAGNTASGKTSTLNAIFSFVPLNERVLITEETPEINIPHRHRVSLIANTELGVSMGDLASDSLRMRPDRLVIGEARTGQEARALLDAITSGQARGSYATFHAQSGKETIARLLSLGILETDIEAIGLIVIQKRIGGVRNKREERRIVEISEVQAGGGSVDAVKIYSYDFKSRALKRTKNFSKTEETVMNALDLDRKGFQKELK
ncbi:MAG: ATPase, T2SS/T4P/T4SS family, partial [Candidatus Micrarchaeota archaeon]